MTRSESRLFASEPKKSRVALLIIDVINDLDFPEGEMLLEHAQPMSERILYLKREAAELNIPAIYVNDNFGRWQSDFTTLVRHCIDDHTCGADIVKRMEPDESDYFVLKPKHSGFYETTLSTLLHFLEAKELIITGMAGNICVLFTANDAYMREFKLYVPADCVASNTPEENEYALRQMKSILKADTSPAEELIAKLAPPR